jgi:hypothetical protein
MCSVDVTKIKICLVIVFGLRLGLGLCLIWFAGQVAAADGERYRHAPFPSSRAECSRLPESCTLCRFHGLELITHFQ